MTESTAESPNQPLDSFKDQVRSAVIWRSGTQILGQVIAWASTFLVIRILSPSDYGLFAMTQVVLVFLNMLNGYGLAGGLIQQEVVDRRTKQQLFGMLILLNFTLAAAQLLLAPLAAAYYRQEIVAHLLRVQAILYLFTPFIAFPYALLAREMDFRKQAKVNLASSVVGALTAITGAFAGLGVWTLVLAPIALFGTRAIGMTIAARCLMWPSFDFRGAGHIARFGGLMAAGQFFWFLQSQADVFIAGRLFDPHLLGIYTTSLFLTQIFVSKFVPALNDVAFSAYSRIQSDAAAVAAAFTKGARLIMVVAMPFYLGLAATAETLVPVVLGPKWIEAGPIVRLLAIAMPFMTLQVLFAPATDARGKPTLSTSTSVIGAVLMTTCFLVGVQWGVEGLSIAWIAGYATFVAITAARSLPVIGVSLRQLFAAIEPPITAALAMAAGLVLLDRLLPELPDPAHLAVLVAAGGAVYAVWMFVFARGTIQDVIATVRK